MLLLACLPLWCMAQPSDKEPLKIVNQSIDKLKKSAIAVDFSMNYTTATHETNQIEYGKSVIHGDHFYFNMSGLEAFFDGKTQWVYVADINECTITEPTLLELKDVNPLAMIQFYMNNHRVTFDEQVSNDKDWFINLFPHDKKSEHFKVAFQINKKTLYPSRITIYQKNGDKIIFDWMTLNVIGAPTIERFQFQQTNYPNVIMNDMR